MPIAMAFTQMVVKKKVVIVAMLTPLALTCFRRGTRVQLHFNANPMIVKIIYFRPLLIHATKE
jgi:hypothetical protein